MAVVAISLLVVGARKGARENEKEKQKFEDYCKNPHDCNSGFRRVVALNMVRNGRIFDVFLRTKRNFWLNFQMDV